MRGRAGLLLGTAVLLLALALPAAAQANFGIKSLSVSATNEDGSVDRRAGSHPYEYTIQVGLNSKGSEVEGELRELMVELPPGMVGNPLAVPRCPGALFEGQQSRCPGNTQIGVVHIFQTLGEPVVPLYNMTPPLGTIARFGFSIISLNSFSDASLRPSDYGVNVADVTIPPLLKIRKLSITIWGVPAEKSHNAERICVEPNGNLVFGCSVTGVEGEPTEPAPFLTLPTSCTGPLTTTVKISSLEEPTVAHEASVPSLDEHGEPGGMVDCESPPFEPTFKARPETAVSDSPTGLDVNLHIPQNEAPDTIATAHLRDTTVTLPAGLAVNPSAGNGLGACSLAQLGLHEPGPAHCPANSEVGTVAIETPAIDHPLPGTVYLAAQGANPFGSLLALYIVVDDPVTGVIVKLAGRVEPDTVTGQLRTTFLENPQLPFEDLEFHFAGGSRAALTTPPTCGTYTTTADLVPWTSPFAPDALRSDSFPISSSPSGPCAFGEAQMPSAPDFEAGTVAPLAGTYSPFVLRVARENGSQRLAALNVTLPPGVSGRLKGLQECSDAQIAAAAARSNPSEGALERANPSCPASSEVGTVGSSAGSGAPLYVPGHAYLAGPYKGAPLSLAVIVPAIAGPFDLGTVVVRTALYVNERTAQITARSDPLPTILHGIPLDVRSVAIQMNRSNFTLNPTSCEPLAVGGEALSPVPAAAALRQRFQVGGCRGLEFKPQLKLSLEGPTKRSGHPALKAVVTYPKHGSFTNIARAQVGLPHAEFLDQGNLDKVCTQPELRSRTCPKRSIYGHAKAWSPLLDKPLEGPVYIGVGFGHKLPDLVAELNGQVRILLNGRVDTTKHSGIRNTFEVVPDAPVSRFVLEMKGGKKYGLLENSENVCLKPQHANARFVAHDDAVAQLHPQISYSCKKPKKQG
jgi:hypothetical protein